jgi:hypothetical protein
MKASLLLRLLVVVGLLTNITHRSFAQSGTGPTDTGPIMKILSPTNGQMFSAPATIPIVTSVTDTNFVHLFSFYAGTNLLGMFVLDPAGPSLTNSGTITYTWTDVPPGNYTLTVVGTDMKGLTGTSAPVNIVVGPQIPPLVNIIIPTNGETFYNPTNILILADAYNPDGFVKSVEFFAGTNSLGIVSNNPIVLDPPTMVAPGPIVYPLYPFHLLWTNVPPGAYTLTAVAMDYDGITGTSAPVNITVTTNAPPPPTNIPPIVKIEEPTNGATFYVDPNIQICASALDPDGSVVTVQFFAGTNSIGTVTNYPIVVPVDIEAGVPINRLFCLTWSNAPVGAFVLTAVATDNGGAMSTSAPVDITVTTNLPPPPTNIPPVVAIASPPDGAVFIAPADVLIYAEAFDPDGFVRTVQFFAGTNSIGIVTNYPMMAAPLAGPTANGSIIYPGNPFHLLWTNVPTGEYTLTAVATDNGGAMTTSAPVNISVVSPSNAPPVVTIYATDPIAVAGTNYFCVPPAAAFANYCSGTNTATFLVRRRGDDGSDLMVDYAIGGTASNGVDYVALPGYVMIPAGKDYGLITIIPLDNTNVSATPIKTVILSLVEPPTAVTNPPPPYVVGWPGKAEAIIIEDRMMPGPATGLLPDRTFHICMPTRNGTSYCVEVSTNLIDWVPVCTNMVVKSSIQFADPETGGFSGRYYKVISGAGTPAY